jgi:putative endonuclease
LPFDKLRDRSWNIIWRVGPFDKLRDRSHVMKAYMYILLCEDGSYYTGSTTNLDQRVVEHQNGEGANYTRERLPVKLVYFEVFDRIDEAFCREKQIQGWSRKKKEALIKRQHRTLPELSRNHTQFPPTPSRPTPSTPSTPSTSSGTDGASKAGG